MQSGALTTSVAAETDQLSAYGISDVEITEMEYSALMETYTSPGDYNSTAWTMSAAQYISCLVVIIALLLVTFFTNVLLIITICSSVSLKVTIFVTSFIDMLIDSTKCVLGGHLCNESFAVYCNVVLRCKSCYISEG